MEHGAYWGKCQLVPHHALLSQTANAKVVDYQFGHVLSFSRTTAIDHSHSIFTKIAGSSGGCSVLPFVS
jgi:hypothetical protein